MVTWHAGWDAEPFAHTEPVTLTEPVTPAPAVLASGAHALHGGGQRQLPEGEAARG
jgi:hypothetical protein